MGVMSSQSARCLLLVSEPCTPHIQTTVLRCISTVLTGLALAAVVLYVRSLQMNFSNVLDYAEYRRERKTHVVVERDRER